MTDKKRGFALLSQEERIKNARKGALAAHAAGTAYKFTSDAAKAAGAIGGAAVIKKRGVAYMVEIGARGGAKVSIDREHMSAIGQMGGQAVSRDRRHMAEIGAKGGASTRKAEP